VISSLAKTIETSSLPRLHYLWCMAQRSLDAVTKVYYRSMLSFTTVSQQIVLLAVLRFPA
jgi:hypothetical protein